jgi:hypothetical protein
MNVETPTAPTVTRNAPAEGRTRLQGDRRRSAQALLPCWAQRAVIVDQFVGHASCRLDVFGSPGAVAALAGRFILSAGLQRAVSRLDRSIVLRRIRRREEGVNVPAIQEATHGVGNES